MGKRRSQKQKRSKGPIRKLWGYFKLLVILLALGCVAYGFWYSKQDEATQTRSQEQALVGLDWLIDRDETKKEADKVLKWIAQQIPVSQSAVISVGDIEGSDRYTFAGVPTIDRPLKVMKNQGYIVGYDEARKNPAWVAYRLEYASNASTVKRPSGFDSDRRTRAEVNHHDYTNTGYDRGHMAPNYAIGRAHGAKAQMETFLMSNIVPQLPDLNRGPWKEVEQLIAGEYLDQADELWILTGPIYDASELKLRSGVVIPVAFFKIIVDVVDDEAVRVLAFKMPQEVDHGKALRTYLTSIDSLESETGLDFLSMLDDEVEAMLEAAPAKRVW